MAPSRKPELLAAAENLLPAAGGAEAFLVEAMVALSDEFRVRALCIDPAEPPRTPPELEARLIGPPPPLGYWRDRRSRAAKLAAAVRDELQARPADLVLTQLHSAPEVAAAGAESGAAVVLRVPSFEGLCKYAHHAASRCPPAIRDCRECPTPGALPEPERQALLEGAAGHARAFELADRVFCSSHWAASACRRWGRRADRVVYPVIGATRALRSDPDGPVLLAAARWNEQKGGDVAAALAHALAPTTPVRITLRGLAPDVAATLAARPGVEPVAGPIEELLEGARLACVPSLIAEAFGRVAFEAMSAGVPVLASDRGGLREQVPAPQRISDPGDLDAWLDAIAELGRGVRREAVIADGRRAAARILATDPLGTLRELLSDAVRSRQLG